MAGSIDIKPVNVSGRTISLYRNGFSSPSQLCSPAPVRSGKTPISPDPISETCSPVRDVNILRRRHSKRRPHLNVQSTNCNTTITTTSELLNNSSSCERAENSQRSIRHSNSLNVEFVYRKECDLSNGRLPRFIRIEQDKEDDEFLSRMHARPLSIAVDAISQLDLYTAKLTDDYSTSTLRPYSTFYIDDNEYDHEKQTTSLGESKISYSNNISNNDSPNLHTATNEIIFVKSNQISSSEHSDATNNNGVEIDNSQHTRNKGLNRDPFHPGAPDVENSLHLPDETNELNSEGLVRISIRPDSHGRFGFNVKGGIDHGMPIIVSRVGANMPADLCIPRLSEGDQILFINHKDVSNQTHLQVVNMIRAASEQNYGTLELLVKPSDYVTDDVNDDNPIPDSGDAPPVPPRSYNSSIRRPTLSLEKFARNSKRLTRFSLKSSSSNNAMDRDHNNSTVHRYSFSGSTLLDSMIELESHLADGSLLNQFEHLPRRKSGLTMNVSRLSENSIKNRYRDISPYDQTRVILKQGSGDYINASFVNMEFPKCGVNLRYIAAQGPLPNTYGDFWQMCWEQQVCLIVMLTAISERGRAKCHQYWPDLNHTVNFSVSSSPRISQSRSSTDLQLKTVREEIITDIAYREFDISQIPSHRASLQSVLRKQTETRRISQLQYISWPDHGVPNDTDQLISFVEQVQRIRGKNQTPIVVHCSAGIGRTGVLIAIETSINLMECNYPVKPLELVQRMREHRAMLIQTTGQFQFVCETILKVFHRNHAENLLKDSTAITSQS
ncbi:unnamed protein product [Schistosoma intercalatum]|nr:unnamed protein product [Schistosoma intercalatum]CAH8527418.1 unnamed protein product [Schistosoma intercalatum]